MLFDQRLQAGVLVRRYKRFLADIRRPDGQVFTAHCPNTGSMLGCAPAGQPVWYSISDRPGRKYPATWELVQTATAMVGVNTGRANGLVAEALAAGLLPDVTGNVRAEVVVEDAAGGPRSRLDFCVTDGACRTWLEVKSVTLGACDVPGAEDAAGLAMFPDAVSARASKHLETLMALRARGDRAMLVYCVQRSGVSAVAPAAAIDPSYAAALRRAVAAGVEVRALAGQVAATGIALQREVPVVC